MMHWNATDGIWYDYDLGTRRHVNSFYLSNALPVFARCYSDDGGPRSLHRYLLATGALNFTKVSRSSPDYWGRVRKPPPFTL